MSWRLPILGFDNFEPKFVQWANGTRIPYSGILGDMSPKTLAREQAEQAYWRIFDEEER